MSLKWDCDLVVRGLVALSVLGDLEVLLLVRASEHVRSVELQLSDALLDVAQRPETHAHSRQETVEIKHHPPQIPLAWY